MKHGPPAESERDRRGSELRRLTRELEESRRLVVELEAQSRALREELEQMRRSASVRVILLLQSTVRRWAPFGTRRQRALHVLAQGAATLVEEGPRTVLSRRRRSAGDREFPDTPEGRRLQYQHWLRKHEPGAEELAALRAEQEGWRYRPTISLVMPVHDPEDAWLEDAIKSVQAQVYPLWELCIVDDASSRPEVGAIVRRAAAADPRIKVSIRRHAGGIAAATNQALALALGEWVGFIDHDDVLRPHALHAMVDYLRNRPDTDVCYSDEDKILPSGERGDPLFKPDWAPSMLLSANYITHFVLLRKRLVDAAGGLREGFEGSQDHDLLLRATEQARHVGHVAQVLYSWRMVRGSAAMSSDYKPLARESGRRAVEDALQRRGLEGRVEFGTYPGFYNVRYAIESSPAVAIVIPTRDRVDLLRIAVDSIEAKSTYKRYSILIVNNQSREPETLAFLRSTKHRVLDFDGPFNFSAMVNAAAAVVEGDHLLLLNNDVSVESPGWIEAMLEQSEQPDVGAVGARLRFLDGTPQHEGVVVGRLHEAANVRMDWPGIREVSAVTGACLMTRHSVFRTVGGFDERLAEAFNDVDYCLRLRQAGYRVIYTPLAELTHREGASRGRRIPHADRERFVRQWGDRAGIQDPYLNANVLWPNPLRLRCD